MTVLIRSVLINTIIFFLFSSCIITHSRGYIAHETFHKSKNYKIRTDGFYLSEIKKEQRVIFIFYANGFFYHEYDNCKDVTECKHEIQKMNTYVNSSKNDWGGYWIEKDSILHLQYFTIMGAGLFMASRGVYEFEAVISNMNSFNIILSKNLYYKTSTEYNINVNFYQFSFKPASTNWIMGKKWYKNSIQRTNKHLNK